MSARKALVAVALAAFVAAATGCSSDREPVRVGVLIECSGLFSSTKSPSLAGAALPLVEGGARAGAEPGDLEGARAGGRPVELVPACTEIRSFSRLIAETRWLVETKDVDIVVGPLGTSEGTVMRQLAAKYPDVTFLVGAGIAQETTLRAPTSNLFRFTPDGAQSVAGLGSYAFDELGWRRAAVVTEGYAGGWELAAGFVAEFCALGGTVVERDFQSLFSPDPSLAARRHARAADGVAVLSTFSTPSLYLRHYAAATKRDLRRRLVLSGSTFSDRVNLAPPGVDIRGVVVGSFLPLYPGDRSMDAYRASFERTFPALPPESAVYDATIGPYTAVKAVVAALEVTGGELGGGQDRLREALEGLTLEAPQGPVRLDSNRQAVTSIALQRIVGRASGKAELRLVRTIDGVDQSFGGRFTASTRPPSWDSPACASGNPPPWAG